MRSERLVLQSVEVRAVSVPLRRPVVSKVGRFDRWPLALGWLQAAPIAAANGIPVSTHLRPEVAAHLMRVTESAHWLEWQDWASPVLKQPFALDAGHLVIPDLPGSGIQWEPAAVARYAH